MALAIIGHPTRGAEIIEILKGLGGEEQPLTFIANNPKCTYFIDRGIIVESWIPHAENNVVSIEELDFLYEVLKKIKEL